MRLLTGEHCYAIVGEAEYLKIIKGPFALTQACDLVARMRLTGGSYKIMEPRFCEHGCCILDRWLDYVGVPNKECTNRGRALV